MSRLPHPNGQGQAPERFPPNTLATHPQSFTPQGTPNIDRMPVQDMANGSMLTAEGMMRRSTSSEGFVAGSQWIGPASHFTTAAAAAAAPALSSPGPASMGALVHPSIVASSTQACMDAQPLLRGGLGNSFPQELEWRAVASTTVAPHIESNATASAARPATTTRANTVAFLFPPSLARGAQSATHPALMGQADLPGDTDAFASTEQSGGAFAHRDASEDVMPHAFLGSRSGRSSMEGATVPFLRPPVGSLLRNFPGPDEPASGGAQSIQHNLDSAERPLMHGPGDSISHSSAARATAAQLFQVNHYQQHSIETPLTHQGLVHSQLQPAASMPLVAGRDRTVTFVAETQPLSHAPPGQRRGAGRGGRNRSNEPARLSRAPPRGGARSRRASSSASMQDLDTLNLSPVDSIAIEATPVRMRSPGSAPQAPNPPASGPGQNPAPSTQALPSAPEDLDPLLMFTFEDGRQQYFSEEVLKMRAEKFRIWFERNFNPTEQDQVNMKLFRRRKQLRDSSGRSRRELKERQRQLELELEHLQHDRLEMVVDVVTELVAPVIGDENTVNVLTT